VKAILTSIAPYVKKGFTLKTGDANLVVNCVLNASIALLAQNAVQ
jgi:hypothetical protein